jgi:hypothetical protein
MSTDSSTSVHNDELIAFEEHNISPNVRFKRNYKKYWQFLLEMDHY